MLRETMTDLVALLAVGREGSFTRVRLLTRTTRSVAPTEANLADANSLPPWRYLSRLCAIANSARLARENDRNNLHCPYSPTAGSRAQPPLFVGELCGQDSPTVRLCRVRLVRSAKRGFATPVTDMAEG